MSNVALDPSSEPLKDQVQQKIQEIAPWVARVGRVGLAFRGIVYLLVGSLAAMAAIGAAGGRTTGTRGAVEVIAQKPFGTVLLACATVGLLGFSLWQLLLAVPGSRPHWFTPLRTHKRLLCLGRAIGNLGLAAVAVNVLMARRHGSDDQAARDWTAWLMGYPLGLWLVGAVGAGLVVYGLVRIGLAFYKDPASKLDLSSLGDSARTTVRAIGRFGIAARGAVFTLLGFFLIASAYYRDPNHARGLGGTMHVLARQDYGPALLGVAAAGLAAFGLYCLIAAWFYRPHQA